MTISEIIGVYWPVFISVIGGMISIFGVYLNINNKINDTKAVSQARYESLLADGAERDKDIAQLKGRIDTMTPDLGTIKTDIAVIKNTLEYIKGSVQSKPAVTLNQ